MNVRATLATFLILLSLLTIVKASNVSCDATITITDNQVTIKLAGIADKETSYQVRKAADISGNGYITEEEARNNLGAVKAIFGFDLEKQNFLNVDGLVAKLDSKGDEFPNLPGEAMSTNPVTLKSQYATDPNIIRGYFTSGKHRITFNFKTDNKVSFSLALPSGIDEKNATYSRGTQDAKDKKIITGELGMNEPLTISFGPPTPSTSGSTSGSAQSTPKIAPGFELLLSSLTLMSVYILRKRGL